METGGLGQYNRLEKSQYQVEQRQIVVCKNTYYSFRNIFNRKVFLNQEIKYP
jgi:hypothetical protein